MKINSSNTFYGLLAGLCFLLAGCRDPFNPDIREEEKSILVVDGVLNGAGATSIRLSRTTAIGEPAGSKPETKASVTVESDANGVYPLSESSPGTYTLAKTAFPATARFRLSIKTNAGQTYRSDYVPMKAAPPIDAITWSRQSDGIQVFVNTHDASKNSRYYRWETESTWQIRAILSTGITPVPVVINGFTLYSVGPITGAYPYKLDCWKSENSSNILLASSLKLSEDRIALQPVCFIPNGGQQLSNKYSILVRQYTLTPEAFEFWQDIRKNSETLGSLFSPQPSATTGNIHAEGNAAVPAIGFFEACAVTEKRIFIDRSEVPDWVYSYGCQTQTIRVENLPAANIFNDRLPVAINGVELVVAPTRCLDCSVEAPAVKPPFWP